MTEPNIYLGALAGISLIIAIPVSIYASYKSLVAKTFTQKINYTVLFVAPILITFALAELAGIAEFPRFPQEHQTVPSVSELFGKMPAVQIVLVAISGIIWIVGLKLLMNSHKKRTEKSWWDMANPFKPQFGDFNKREWSIFITILVTAMLFGYGALAVQ